MKTTLRDIGTIKPYKRNPRVNDQAVDAVAASLEEFGFRQPIVVDGKGVIVVGHTRWKAAKKLGLKRVPVHVATDLTAKQIKAYRIADNQTNTLAEWDDNLLKMELQDLRKGKFDLDLLGFSPTTLAELLGAEKLEDEPEEPEIAETYAVVIECESEAEQQKLYERLTKQGLSCRLLSR